ncbi:MAG: HNH endonuclease signature motif containing protein [Candidatus Pedobacter colombiensis]|uniref:HNH endonuclease signature motif containing protein n=1 Tax=Candidatus Pedobacter colombiensis TaxID=3121371 RepID=A0AAJ5WB72_9SPHI|nr:HNH endonuclease signature motif containing protein [Pedobacter sp.]WEK20395.1 MAG: HNH endonuclease signature motif containing protein [Pedobacter sp.]
MKSIKETLHIDGTVCLKKRTVASKAKIVKYWENTVYQYLGCDIEVGFPGCWACGFAGFKEEEEEVEVYENWNRQGYLDRCHIVPKAHSGCNCEANLVLLCRKCHRASPDTRSAELFVRWLNGRKSWWELTYKEIADAALELNFSFEDFDLDLDAYKDEFQRYLRLNAIPVGGTLARTTFLACLIEFRELVQGGSSSGKIV